MNFNDPVWKGWEDVKDPQPIIWKVNKDYGILVGLEECFIGNCMVMWLERRPYYCDRGHFMVNSSIPDLDSQDRFPRYYMYYDNIKPETEAWLKWRLWKVES